MTTPFASIWTNDDTAERGPTVDEQAAEVSTDFAELMTVLHVATDGPHGLWAVAVTLDPENAVSLIEKIAERYGLTVAPQVLGQEESFADILADPDPLDLDAVHPDTSQLAKDLMTHYQHDVEVAQYTDGDHDPANVSLECLTDGTVIYTEDITPDDIPDDGLLTPLSARGPDDPRDSETYRAAVGLGVEPEEVQS